MAVGPGRVTAVSGMAPVPGMLSMPAVAGLLAAAAAPPLTAVRADRLTGRHRQRWESGAHHQNQENGGGRSARSLHRLLSITAARGALLGGRQAYLASCGRRIHGMTSSSATGRLGTVLRMIKFGCFDEKSSYRNC